MSDDSLGRSIPPLGSIPRGSQGTIERCSRQHVHRKPKIWTFTEQPKFVKYDGNVRVTGRADPQIELFRETRELVALAQLPGVSETDIKVTIVRDILSIHAPASSGTGAPGYDGEVLLPFEVEEEPVSMTFNNYILELRLARKVRH